MTRLTKITFILFIASLPGCYFTAVPVVMSALVFLALYGEERFVQYGERATMEEITRQLQTHSTALDALNMRLGMGAMPRIK